ncbi:hypothetical protein ES731_08205 [Psychroflexus gondwanensis]|nr:hypothetical protein ES731_08205 [Psychroflexus gondwanensis]
MPIYKHDKTLIITNLKVMSSSLNNTKNLKRLTRKSFVNICFCIFSNKINKVMLVRDPYKRVISIYNNKFKNFQYPDQKLQYIHKIFLKSLYKDKKFKNLNVSEILNSITFDEFLLLLKKVYESDGHTKLQSKILVDYKVKIKNLKIIKIENKKGLGSFFENLDLKIPHLNKNNLKEILVLNKDQKEIIHEIYKKDFENFDYEK